MALLLITWRLKGPATLQWRHIGRDGVSNHQPYDCLRSRLFGCRSKKTSKPRVTGLCAGNFPGTDDFPAQMASNAESVSIWWRHHDQQTWYWSLREYSYFRSRKVKILPLLILFAKPLISTRHILAHMCYEWKCDYHATKSIMKFIMMLKTFSKKHKTLR